MDDLRIIELLFKAYTFITNHNVDTGKFNTALFMLKNLCPLALLVSTISGVNSKCFAQNWMELTQDILLLISCCITAGTIIFKKEEISTLFKMIQTEMPLMKTDPEYVQALDDYHKWLKIFGYVIRFLLTVLSTILINVAATPYQTMPNKSALGCIKLAHGSVLAIDSYSFYVIAQMFSVIVFLYSGSLFIVWLSLMFISTIKIKLKTKYLIIDLNCISDSYLREVVLPEITFERRSIQCRGEKTTKQFAKCLLINATEQHIEIIKYVGVVDKTFRLFAFVFGLISVLMGVLGVPGAIKEGKSMQSLKVVVRVLGFLSLPAILNFCGQIVIGEFDNLRWAIYNINWQTQPRGFQKNVVLMQIVANRRRGLTAGGMVVLSRETFGNILFSFGSYSNVLLTVTS